MTGQYDLSVCETGRTSHVRVWCFLGVFFIVYFNSMLNTDMLYSRNDGGTTVVGYRSPCTAVDSQRTFWMQNGFRSGGTAHTFLKTLRDRRGLRVLVLDGFVCEKDLHVLLTWNTRRRRRRRRTISYKSKRSPYIIRAKFTAWDRQTPKAIVLCYHETRLI